MIDSLLCPCCHNFCFYTLKLHTIHQLIGIPGGALLFDNIHASYVGQNAPVVITRMVTSQTETHLRNKVVQPLEKDIEALRGKISMPFPIASYHATSLQIDMIYLGPHFLGGIEDIAREDWWEDAECKQDIVSRKISSNISSFIGFSFYNGRYYSPTTRVFEAGYLNEFATPASYLYRLASDRVPLPTDAQRRISGNYGHEAYIFSSDTGGSKTTVVSDKGGYFVRLFSDR